MRLGNALTPATRTALEELRVTVVAGMTVGIVAGIGSRLAMLLLRLTSPASVHGVTSDDGFIIGQVTLKGTYNLLGIGAFVGVIGAAAYRLVAPRLIGPRWFRRLTTALAAGAVVGSMLLHADGIDFVVLKPTWLATSLFIALPAAFGALVGPVVDSVSAPTSRTAQGRYRAGLPIALLVVFPLTLVATAITAVVLMCWVRLRERSPIGELRRSTPFGLAVRAAWLATAFAGLGALIVDIADIT